MNTTNTANTTNAVTNTVNTAATQAQLNEVLDMLERILTAQERLETLVLARTSGAGNVSSIAKSNLLDV
jgi:hypothetical protein